MTWQDRPHADYEDARAAQESFNRAVRCGDQRVAQVQQRSEARSDARKSKR